MENLELWQKVAQPPKWALKEIKAGRLKGKSDINPQWRYQVLTEQFGPCGSGWKFNVDKLWTEQGSDGQVMCFAHISLFVRTAGESWGDAIPGIGGSTLVAKEKSGLYSNDEGYKMAVTDALSTACKMLGIAADIYKGRFDGTEYRVVDENDTGFISESQAEEIDQLMVSAGYNTPPLIEKFMKWAGCETVESIPSSKYGRIKAGLQSAIKARVK